jgi:hypothetical protein
MFRYEKVFLEQLEPTTSLEYQWDLVFDDEQRVRWKGFYTGPLTLTTKEIETLCLKLLGIDITELQKVASQELQPAPLGENWPALVMHSQTPDVKSFEQDLLDLMNGPTPLDHTTYAEARSAYFARQRDLAIGRTNPWKTAIELEEINAIEIPGIDYYYLSHALLLLAEEHLRSPTLQINRIIEFLRNNEHPIVRVYNLEKEMQIFLIWLKRLANLENLSMDTNTPEVAQSWNRKSILHPTVRDALELEEMLLDHSPRHILEVESRSSILYKKLNLTIPVLPGYTIERSGEDLDSFIQQTIQAARLLRQRYRLERGCLKASEAADGARIFAGLNLRDELKIETLAKDAYQHGDDYLLEAHIEYLQVNVGGQILKTTPSAHIRWGRVAEGLTLQTTQGTSWKGNIYIDEAVGDLFGVSKAHYQIVTETMKEFLRAFQSRSLGLMIAGIDFAIGRIGGVFEDEVLVAAQDPNVSFNGAECLRIFIEKVKEHHSLCTNEPFYAATRVIRPTLQGTLPVLRQITDVVNDPESYSTTIASIPGCWGMIALANRHPEEVVKKLASVYDSLIYQNLII